jgi:thiol-disulfide isomerase/thioredoxin
MSKNNVELDEVLKNMNRAFVLFYTSWCPFSRKFLPVYEKCTVKSPNPCLRVMVDDKADLCLKYSIKVFPTVLLFENGGVTERLDGESGVGLSEKQLKKLLDAR